MMREALRRRAERVAGNLPTSLKTHPVPTRPLSISSRGGEGRGSRRWWLAVPSISVAAAIVVGVFVLRHEPKDVTIQEHLPVAEATAPTSCPPRGEGVVTPTSITAEAVPQEVKSHKTVHSAPSLTGRAGGESSQRAGGESESGPSVAELYATIDAMTDQALREAERLTIETLSRNVAAEQPS